MRVMKYKGYYGSVEYWMKYNMFHGSCQIIKDSITYEAITEEELEKEFKAAVEDYLNYCKEVGNAPEITSIKSLD